MATSAKTGRHAAPGSLRTNQNGQVEWRPPSESSRSPLKTEAISRAIIARLPRSGRVYSEKRLQRSQDAVMAAYRRKRYVKNKEEAGRLHMWFSQYRVPRGLTRQEVRMCLDLQQLCQNMFQNHNVNGSAPVWDPMKPMTRAHFAKGLSKVLACLAKAKLPQAVVEYVYSTPRIQ